MEQGSEESCQEHCPVWTRTLRLKPLLRASSFVWVWTMVWKYLYRGAHGNTTRITFPKIDSFNKFMRWSTCKITVLTLYHTIVRKPETCTRVFMPYWSSQAVSLLCLRHVWGERKGKEPLAWVPTLTHGTCCVMLTCSVCHADRWVWQAAELVHSLQSQSRLMRGSYVLAYVCKYNTSCSVPCSQPGMLRPSCRRR